MKTVKKQVRKTATSHESLWLVTLLSRESVVCGEFVVRCQAKTAKEAQNCSATAIAKVEANVDREEFPAESYTLDAVIIEFGAEMGPDVCWLK